MDHQPNHSQKPQKKNSKKAHSQKSSKPIHTDSSQDTYESRTQEQAFAKWMQSQYDDNEFRAHKKQADLTGNYQSSTLESNARQLLLSMSLADDENYPVSRQKTGRDYFLDTHDVFEVQRGKQNPEKHQKSFERSNKRSHNTVTHEPPYKKSPTTFHDTERLPLRAVPSKPADNLISQPSNDLAKFSVAAPVKKSIEKSQSPITERNHRRKGLKTLSNVKKQPSGLQQLFIANSQASQADPKTNKTVSNMTQKLVLEGNPLNKSQGLAVENTKNLEIETKMRSTQGKEEQNGKYQKKRTASLPSSMKASPRNMSNHANHTNHKNHVNQGTFEDDRKKTREEQEQEIRIDTRTDNPLRRFNEKGVDTNEVSNQSRRVSEIMKACLPRIMKNEFGMEDPLYLSQKMTAIGTIMGQYKKWKDENEIAIKRASAMRVRARVEKQRQRSQNSECESMFNDQKLQISAAEDSQWKFKEESFSIYGERNSGIFGSIPGQSERLPRILANRHSVPLNSKSVSRKNSIDANELRNNRRLIYY